MKNGTSSLAGFAGDTAERWAVRWADIALTPRHAFSLSTQRSITSVDFFVTNYVAAYVAGLVVAVSYFLTNYRSTFAGHLKDAGVEILLGGSGILLGYLLVGFGGLFLAALLSFLAYRGLGSAASFKAHLSAFLDLTFVEPLSGATVMLLILIMPRASDRALIWLFVAGTVVLLALRAWQMIVGLRAMRALHDLDSKSRRLAAGAFAATSLVLNVLVAAMTWFFAVLLVVRLD